MLCNIICHYPYGLLSCFKVITPRNSVITLRNRFRMRIRCTRSYTCWIFTPVFLLWLPTARLGLEQRQGRAVAGMGLFSSLVPRDAAKLGSWAFGSGTKLRHWCCCSTVAVQHILLSCDKAGGLCVQIPTQGISGFLKLLLWSWSFLW